MNIDTIEQSVFAAVREADRRRNAALHGGDQPWRFGPRDDAPDANEIMCNENLYPEGGLRS